MMFIRSDLNQNNRELDPNFVLQCLKNPFAGEFFDRGTPESLEAANDFYSLWDFGA